MSTPVTTSLNAWRRVSKTDRVAIKECGRVCGHDGCATILSIYNPAGYCSAHVTVALSRRRRGRSQPVLSMACDHCGEEFETRNVYRRYCSDRCRMAAFARRKRAAERALHRVQPRTAEAAGAQATPLGEDAA